MAEPKPFQSATVDAVCRNFARQTGSRRFLVADEVGLGKTVVAREVIRRLANQRGPSLVVYYITSGQRVAHQNRARLIDFLAADEQKRAVSKADRLGLIPLAPRPDTPVAVYALTPGTSFPGKKLRLHGGRKEERAFLAGMLGRTLPRLVRKLPEGILRGTVKSSWDDLLASHRNLAAKAPRTLVRAFRAALAAEFGGHLRTSIPAAAAVDRPGRFVGRLRRALAHAVLISRPPDVVILDEFQRYRDLLSPEGRRDRLIAALLEGRTRPAVLLLSATPYKLYATRWEESQGVEAHRELFDLPEFLGGDAGVALRESASTTFAKFGNALRAIVASETASSGASETSKQVSEAKSLRVALEGMLTPFLSRTEREPFSDDSAQTIALPTTIEPIDVRAFRHLASSFDPDDKAYALPYWLSVPLPAQALGPRYQAWRHATFHRDGAVVKLTLKARNRFAVPGHWPHPKLRALRDVVKPETLALPWTAPSIPWWPLGGPWALGHDPKLLLFSRFKATPQSIAALTSLGVEAKYLSASMGGYENAWRRRRIQAGPKRLATLALFHPSPLLIRTTDPLKAFGGHPRSPRAVVRGQLLQELDRLEVKVAGETAKQRERRRPVWYVLSALERLAGDATITGGAWREAAGEDRQLLALVADWHKSRKLEWISRRELDDLVTAALAYPGIVVGRALLRHDAGTLNPDRFRKIVRLAWHGLRPYLDNPVFWARLPGSKPVQVLPRACHEGNLEAVLDEHFWIKRQSLSEGREGLADDLREVLGIASGAFSFHSTAHKGGPRIRVRCHAAVPFGSTDDEDSSHSRPGGERPPRSDEIRKAFNAPFWPHVLTTTSVGQEGLDFHTWCRRIAHWDLCSSPLELEQREGRIQRYAGLAVRRQLSDLPKEKLSEAAAGNRLSLWDVVARLADEAYRDPSGLSPWWVLKGAAVSRYVFDLPQGRDAQKFSTLKEQRLIYRLALGQPNQEDLVEVLARGGATLRAILKPLALDLSAFTHRRAEPQETLVAPHAHRSRSA